MKRIRRTPTQWNTLIKTFEASGLKAIDFCQQENIDAKYFSKKKGEYKSNLNKTNSFVAGCVAGKYREVFHKTAQELQQQVADLKAEIHQKDTLRSGLQTQVFELKKLDYTPIFQSQI